MTAFQVRDDTVVTTVGEILVEIMSLNTGAGFKECQDFRGPFPSGAPAIFIDQIAKLGLMASMVGAVGDDDFGRLNIERLKHSGVDVSSINVCSDKPTGIAFVRYQSNGERDFLFTLSTSAAIQIDSNHLEQQLKNTTHLHVVGSSMSVTSIADYVMQAVEYVKQKGGTVSFDPNVRPEIMQQATMQDRLTHVLHRCDVFMPSEGEIDLFFNRATETEAVAKLLHLGVAEIIIKRGENGAHFYSRHGHQIFKAYAANEVDPTGAGDCFGATYIANRLIGRDVEVAMNLACAAGALAVMKQGPMEGNSSLPEIEAFMRNPQASGTS